MRAFFTALKWDDPGQWAAEGGSCTAPALAGPVPRAVRAAISRATDEKTKRRTSAAPRVTVTKRDGKTLGLGYVFEPSELRGPDGPSMVELSVDSVEAKWLPRLVRRKVTSSRGFIRLPRDVRGKGPCKIDLTAISERGRCSRTYFRTVEAIG